MTRAFELKRKEKIAIGLPNIHVAVANSKETMEDLHKKAAPRAVTFGAPVKTATSISESRTVRKKFARTRRRQNVPPSYLPTKNVN